VTRDHEASVVVETDAPGESAIETEAPVKVGSCATASGGAGAGATAGVVVEAASAAVYGRP
jgi:hypothetical protein